MKREEEWSPADFKAIIDYCNECIDEVTWLDNFGILQIRDEKKFKMYHSIKRHSHEKLLNCLNIEE